MPAIGANGGIQRGARLPGTPAPKVAPPPKPIPTARANVSTGANPRGVAIATPAPRPTVNDRAAATLGTGANPRGTSIIHATPPPTYEKSPGYQKAVINVFQHQAPAQKKAVLNGAMKSPSFEGNLILHYVKQVGSGPMGQLNLKALGLSSHDLSNVFQATAGKSLLPPDIIGNVGRWASNALGKGESVLMGLHNSATQGPEGSFSGVSQAGLSAGKLGTLAVKVPVDVTRAALESPSVIPKTVKGLGEAAVGGLAGLAEVPVKEVTDTLHGHPAQAFTDLWHGLSNDYKTRYGPLLAGHDRAFIDRIKQQGAGPEALDALGLAGGVDATAGRAAVDMAKTGAKLGGRDEAAGFLTRPRPGLRVAGGEVRPQNLARTAGRVAAQRGEDALRRGKERVMPGEITPGANEVRPLFGNRSQRVLSSFVASKYRTMMQRGLNNEVRNGAARSLGRLSRWERKAAPVVLEGTIPLRRGPEAARDAIDQRIVRIQHYRAENPKASGNHIPPQHADQVDELRTLQQLRANVGKWFTPRLAKFVDEEGARHVRLEGAMPDSYLRQPVAEARRLRPQGEALGVEHPDEIAARGGDLTQEHPLHSAMSRPLGRMNGRPIGKEATIRGAAENAASVAVRGKEPQFSAFGDALNRERKVLAAKPKAELLARYDELRPGLLQDYSARVRALAREKGLPEPSFFHHTNDPAEKFGDFTSGTGHRAMPAAKRTSFELYKSGAVWRDPRAYLTGLARSIKVGHQWPLVDEQLRRASLPEPSAAAIKAAGYGGRRADTLTGREYLNAMLHDGHKAENLRLYNPGRLRESTLAERGLLAHQPSVESRAGSVPPELEANQMLHELLGRHVVSGDAAGHVAADDPFLKTAGWKALPPAAYKEIHSSLAPSGLGGRLVGKIQGTTAHLILGGSPSFLVMNTLAHAVLAAYGTRGRLLTDAAKFPMWWHGLTEDQRALVDAHAGGRVQAGSDRFGSTTPSRLAQGWDTLKQKGVGRVTVGRLAGMANPFHVLFRAEDLQSNFFRRTVYYNATKRAALNSMAKDMSQGASAMNRLAHAFKVGPREQMLAQIANMHTAEELGRYTVNMMGDYARFTSFERKFINNRAVLFYSFMRHATRTLFFVLPLHHPIATALVGELANLHNEEVKQLLGGADLPYADSRLFFDANGKLTSIDMARASPIGSVGAELPSEGIAGAAQVIPPEIQPILNAMYGQSPTGSAYKPSVLSLLNSYLSQSYPVRLVQELHDGTQLQQSDSIPFVHDDPQTRKSAAAQAYLAAKEAALGPNRDRILGSLLGLYPKPDDLGVIGAHHAASSGGSAGTSDGKWSVVHSNPAGTGATGTKWKVAPTGDWGGGSSSSGGWG